MNCACCDRPLTYDEYGLNRKFHAGRDMLCIGCLAEDLDVTQERLKEKMEELRKAGCMYFSRRKNVEV